MPGEIESFLGDLVNPQLVLDLDIDRIVTLDDGKAWVGFTSGGVNGATASVDIASWSFSPARSPGG